MSQSLTEFKPGWHPVGPRLIVYPTPIEAVSKGGIALPAIHTEREELRQVEALVISVGYEAFEDNIAAWCEPGDVILMAAFAGRKLTGTDGKVYRTILDGEVVAVKLNEPVVAAGTDQVIEPVGIDSAEGFGHGS